MDFHHHHHHHHHCMSLETTAAHSKKVRFSRCSHVHLADCREFSQGSEHSRRSAACPFPQLTLFFFATHALPFSRLTPSLFPDSRLPFSRLTPPFFPTHAALFPDSRIFFPTHASLFPGSRLPFFLTHASFSRLTPLFPDSRLFFFPTHASTLIYIMGFRGFAPRPPNRMEKSIVCNCIIVPFGFPCKTAPWDFLALVVLWPPPPPSLRCSLLTWREGNCFGGHKYIVCRYLGPQP